MTSTAKPHSPTTTAFYAQAVASFATSLIAVGLGVAYLPVNGWVRAFLALGLLFTVTSAFTLAKCVRDRQEETYVVSRVDQARLEKLLAEHDPYRVEPV
ncbi:YiaA/YiaB family inner membrane protein [Saccharothrix isguenensis]